VKKHPEVARVLIEDGADVHARSKGGFTPLLFAAQQGDLDSARILLAAGANVNAATPDGDTALLVASASGHEALAIFLLDKGADPNAAERNGITALHYAMLKGLVRMVGINQRRPFAPYLYRPNMVELVKALLARGANPNARLVSATVPQESGPGYGKIIRIANNISGSINPTGATAFMMAAVSYDASLMRILAAAGADPLLATEEGGVTALMVAAGVNRQRESDLTPDDEERSALEAVKVAVELGADVNAADSTTGLTALHGAAMFGLNGVVQFLAEKGANLDAKDKAGQTPLDKALNIKPPGVLIRNLLPITTWKSTADLLLKLGATPVSASVAQSSDSGAATAGH
jgi:ankyrin repeat protein